MHKALGTTLFSIFLLAGCSGGEKDRKDTGSPPAAADISRPLDGSTSTPPTSIAPTEQTGPTVHWDEWGVPHITANTPEDAFYAMGWVQMRGRGDLVLQLMGQGRGRAAEYWGEEYLESDVIAHRLNIPDLAQNAYKAQGPVFAARLDAFAQGINDFAEAHPELLSDEAKRVLPVTATDFLGHNLRAIHFSFVAGRDLERLKAELTQTQHTEGEAPGSNAWAIGGSKAADGGTMLLANPHLPWEDLFYFFEVHLKTPDMDAYGVTLIGHPFLAIAFNEHLGWTHTVNTHDGVDVYAFARAESGYTDYSGPASFATEDITLRIRLENGEIAEKPITLKNTSAGPVLFETEDTVYAVKVAGMDADRLRMTEQYWSMGNAANLSEFKAAMAQHQMPMFNTIYADSHGDIYYLFNALAPVRQKGDAALWKGVLPGDDPELRWSAYHPFSSLPQFENPSTGFIQNANETPWTATVPTVLDPANYPADFIPPVMQSRPQHSLDLLMSDDSITLDELINYSHSDRLVLAESVLDDLIETARAHESTSEGTDLAAAADVLAGWDRSMAPDSKGAALFYHWAEEYKPEGAYFDTPWSFDEPGRAANGVGDDEKAINALQRAITATKDAHGQVDAPWGAVARIRRDGEDLPVAAAPGDMGAFRVGWLGKAGEDGVQPMTGGTTYVAAMSFAETFKATAILPYGNFEKRPDFVTSQWPLFSEGKMRDVHYRAEDVEDAARFVETLSPDHP